MESATRDKNAIPNDSSVVIEGSALSMPSKFILVRRYFDNGGKTVFVSSGAKYHTDIYNAFVEGDSNVHGKATALGGGRFYKDDVDKTLIVWGTSDGLGSSDYNTVKELLHNKYKDFCIIVIPWLDKGSLKDKIMSGTATSDINYLRYNLNELGVDSELFDGKTALHVAAMFGEKPAARCILDMGANQGIRDLRGRTPMDIAKMHAYADPDKYSGVLFVLDSTEKG
ncbi:MAG: hypothetical protein ACREBH_03915 [Candidatus Micrarchaeaceae archaeon]